MKTKRMLIVYYSRTEITKKVADAIAKTIKCDVERIVDLKKRDGAMGYFIGGKDAATKATTRIKPLKKNIENYDLVIMGTPIWSWTITPAIRSFIEENKELLKEKDREVAFFCTMGGSGDDKAFAEMSRLCDKNPIANLTLLTKDIVNGNYSEKIDIFAKAIMKL